MRLNPRTRMIKSISTSLYEASWSCCAWRHSSKGEESVRVFVRVSQSVRWSRRRLDRVDVVLFLLHDTMGLPSRDRSEPTLLKRYRCFDWIRVNSSCHTCLPLLTALGTCTHIISWYISLQVTNIFRTFSSSALAGWMLIAPVRRFSLFPDLFQQW